MVKTSPDDEEEGAPRDGEEKVPVEPATHPRADTDRARLYAEALDEVAHQHRDLFALLAK